MPVSPRHTTPHSARVSTARKASHLHFTDSLVYPPLGTRPLEGKWALSHPFMIT